MKTIKYIAIVIAVSCFLCNCKSNVEISNEGNFSNYYQKYEPKVLVNTLDETSP